MCQTLSFWEFNGPRETLVGIQMLLLDAALDPNPAIQLTISHLTQVHPVTIYCFLIWGTKEGITDTCIVLGIPLITHHISLEFFIFIPAGLHTQQLSSPLALSSIRGPGIFYLNHHARGIPHSLSLSIILPCFLVLTAHLTVWNCFLCLLVCLFIISS